MVTRRILFPFSFDRDFQHGYSWAMELAVKMNATLCFFTAIPDRHPDLNPVYQSLLQARGSYLQSSPLSTPPLIARTEQRIEKGEFRWSLLKFVKNTSFDVVVLDRSASALTADTIRDVVENAHGVIVLPDQKIVSEVVLKEHDEKSTMDFYDVLSHSDCYQLQSNFFRILGQDKGLFNYLRSFFRKKECPSP